LKRIVTIALSLLIVLSTLALVTSGGNDELVPVIIGFKGTPNPERVRALGGRIKYHYTIIPAIAARLPQRAVDKLSNAPGIDYVELDSVVHALGETLPWGVDRIDADVVHDYPNTGSGVQVAIVDTGMDYDHPDLKANYGGGYDFVNNDAYPMDDEGHGTHCAGIVAAAKDNTEGVIGVAPSVELYALKVLDNTGSGYLSDVISGIDWAVLGPDKEAGTSDDAEIVSLSLGADTGDASLEDACQSAYESGTLVIASAGNSGNPPGRGDNVGYPARYSSVIAVAATDDKDKRPRWSSTGPDLELSAPGVYIYSTYWDNTYATLSGTSMACPHVSGVAALVFASPMTPGYDQDGDGVWDPVEVRRKLTDTAIDLGDPGKDNQYGYGLVYSPTAVDHETESLTDIAVSSIDAPSSVVQGDQVRVDVTVENTGNQDVASDITVTLTDTTDSVEIGTETITGGLTAGTLTTLTYTWYTTGASIQEHTLEASHDFTDDDTSNNVKSTTVTVNEASGELTITGIDPNSMPAGYTVSVTISGSGFTDGASVTFENGAGPAPEASNIFVDANEITASVTAKSGGPPRNRAWDVRVTNPDGSSAVLLGGFTVNP